MKASSTVAIIVTPTAAAAGSGNRDHHGTAAAITGQYNSDLQNSTSMNTSVNAKTALELDVTAAPIAAQVGQNLTYTVTATDNGPPPTRPACS